MKCPLCQLEARITKSRNIVEITDDVPRLFIEMEVSCVNKNCNNFEKVIETVRNEQPIG